MAIVVRKVPMESVQDTAGIEAAMAEEGFGVDDIVALVAKTEGNGGVNDLGRILVDRVLRDFLVAGGSGGARGRDAGADRAVGRLPRRHLAAHQRVRARVDDPDPDPEAERLAIGIAMSEAIAPEDIGRPAGVEKVAAGVKLAMKDAGIEDASDIHYVQSKSPLLTVETIADAKARGHTVATEETMESMSIANATAALGIGYALGEIPMPREDQIGKDFDVYSSVASCSSGNEQLAAQIVVVGNRKGAGGRFRIGHSVMKDAIDSDGSLRGDPRRRVAAAGPAAPVGSRRCAGQLLRQVRDRSDRAAARQAAGLAQRLRRSSHPHDQGDGGRGGFRRGRRSGGVRLGRGAAAGAGRRRDGRGHRRHGQGARLRHLQMAVETLLRRGLYRDSVTLMRLAAALEARPGVARASAVMATPANLDMLAEHGVPAAGTDAGANDLLIVLEGDDGEILAEALRAAAALLEGEAPPAAAAGGDARPRRPRSLAEAGEALPDAALALISCPGEYAAAEAMKALRLGLDAMIFSDNVPVGDEVALKCEAERCGRLVMGPDCGTAIIGGVPLGFANRVRRGTIGVVGASGTGIQQIACLIDRFGAGISHAIGTGGRDLVGRGRRNDDAARARHAGG